MKSGEFSPLFLQIFFLTPFSLLSFLDLIMHMLVYVIVLYRSLSSVYFSSFFLFILQTISSQSIYICWLFLLLALICCWDSLVKFLFQLLYFSTPKPSFVFFKIIFITILIFPIYWNMVLLFCFNCLDMFSLSYLNIIKISSIKSCLISSMAGFPQRLLIFLSLCHIFLCLGVSYNLFLNTF